MTIDADKLKKISQIFLPTSSKRIDELEDNQQRLVHYTSAESALKIIQNKKLWLRNTRVMDDWSEVDHGLGLLKSYFLNPNNPQVGKFHEVMEKCHKDSGKDVLKIFDNLLTPNYQETYISCFSSHLDTEDKYGRLSMWRAFSERTAGVALIMKPPPRHSATPIKVFLHPVSYHEYEGLAAELDLVINNIDENEAFLKTIDREYLVNFGYLTLMLSIVATKHKGFEEELEWRLIHSPLQFPSEHVKSKNETVRGIPQQIYELELKNNPDCGIENIDFNQLLDRIIIGPTQYSASIHKALTIELALAGVDNPESKIFHSNIPLR